MYNGKYLLYFYSFIESIIIKYTCLTSNLLHLSFLSFFFLNLISGEQSYSCLWLKRRSPNIMEFKFSDKSSSVMDEKLCDDRNFVSGQWITEGSMFPVHL